MEKQIGYNCLDGSPECEPIPLDESILLFPSDELIPFGINIKFVDSNGHVGYRRSKATFDALIKMWKADLSKK